MKNIVCFLFLITVFLVLQITPVFAAPSGDDAIWTKLAGKAARIGGGLRQSGYIIAGFGLIFFSFMAIFNKISWKNLAYIMLSCFVLTAMVGLINYFSRADGNAEISDKFQGNGIGSKDTITIDGGVPKAGGTQPKI